MICSFQVARKGRCHIGAVQIGAFLRFPSGQVTGEFGCPGSALPLQAKVSTSGKIGQKWGTHVHFFLLSAPPRMASVELKVLLQFLP